MSDMVERVARALWAHGKVAPFEDEWRMTNPTEYHALARAAIEAMREPTDEMLSAVRGTPEHHYLSCGDEYRALIEAALKCP